MSDEAMASRHKGATLDGAAGRAMMARLRLDLAVRHA